ncbi:NAD-dependent epimerase/dehydratase family protein [Agromyces sp. CFH 90414]|uniref:NAD-dependent epimerase/dehydratase family protein n=1 Tax=Agromyces agglutinans TaxID=2662258 RepID=A0A6I2FBX6_9MICO|nr:NAD(P)-dependent oxidoreductase [Agromyces agglutinans]MRG59956.1 NAD-dependent epimerase/dehydratase family protein [Agromyces agglutinans]
MTLSIEETVVVTGAAGRIGRAVTPLLRRPGRRLRLVDTVPDPSTAGDDVSWHDVSIQDGPAMARILDGATSLVHLAGLSSERPWADLLRVNIDGTHTVLEAARTAGVRRVLLASSIHAVGCSPVADAADAQPLRPRPDTYYGVSKAAMEALGSLYADRFGISVVSARICTFQEAPGDGRAIAQWLSPGDMARLVEAAIALDDGRHHLVWGVSANHPGWFSLEAGYAIGYRPQDDALTASLARDGVTPPEPDGCGAPLGGAFTDDRHPVGGTW